MLSGKGFIAGEIDSRLPTPVPGFAISTGLHVSIVWGSKSVGLYAEVAAGFDAVLGFDPFLLAGILYIRGTLHVFIIDLMRGRISRWRLESCRIIQRSRGSPVRSAAGSNSCSSRFRVASTLKWVPVRSPWHHLRNYSSPCGSSAVHPPWPLGLASTSRSTEALARVSSRTVCRRHLPHRRLPPRSASRCRKFP